MKNNTKTYGVYGLMDWQPIIYVGRAKFSPLFSGGSATAYGETPAKYITSNPVYQRIIETSDFFKCGHIKLLYKTESESKPLNNVEEKKYEDLSFPSLGDAASYINQQFGTPRTKLRSRETIVEAGKAHGVNIKIED